MKRFQQFHILPDRRVEVVHETTADHDRVVLYVGDSVAKVFNDDYGPPDAIYDVLWEVLAELEKRAP
jgi:hypothetical protein